MVKGNERGSFTIRLVSVDTQASLKIAAERLMESKQHWENVFTTKNPDEVSWFQQHAHLSLKWIAETNLPETASIIDVGGGDSRLVDDLLDKGYKDITVLDLSANALSRAKARLGDNASTIKWIEADITEVRLPKGKYDLWHDRAVFHFLIDGAGRNAYIKTMLRTLKPFGRIILATFAEDGPSKCSGLPVMRYSSKKLNAELGKSVELLRCENELHVTPSANRQKFIYCEFQKLT
ncbi:MAG: class I SAM-dependent methyltransferase [Pseudohongiellaceae bacterium]